MTGSKTLSWKWFCGIALLWVLTAGARSGFGQVVNTSVLQVKLYYDLTEYEKAITTGHSLLNSSLIFSPEELSLLQTYIALAHYNIGQLDSAQTHFLSLLSIDPDAELDPVHTSPKIITFFNNIKKDLQALSGKRSEIPYTRYVLLEDLRPGAGWRSAIFPGWGQFYKEQKPRGLIFGGAFWSSLIATGVSAVKESRTREAYRNSTSAEEIETNYRSYNRWYKARRTFTISTIVLWGVAVGDAFLSPYPLPTLKLDKQGSLALEIRFQW